MKEWAIEPGRELLCVCDYDWRNFKSGDLSWTIYYMVDFATFPAF